MDPIICVVCGRKFECHKPNIRPSVLHHLSYIHCISSPRERSLLCDRIIGTGEGMKEMKEVKA